MSLRPLPVHLILVVLAGCTAPSQNTSSESAAAFSSTGGSVLTFFSLGNFPNDPRPEVWDSDVKGMVPWYHLDPASVRARLAAMRANGQRRVGLVLWFTSPEDGGDIARAHYVIPQADFTLYPQHRENLLNYLRDIDAAGFDEVQIRFGQQGGAVFDCYKNPVCYSTPGFDNNPFFREAIDFNWAFMTSVIGLVEGAGIRTPRLYDLCPEYPGHNFMATNRDWYEFTRAIWSRYTHQLQPNGIAATMSFNHADYDGTEASFRLFDAEGYPTILSMDAYYGIYGVLGTLSDAMRRHGRGSLPVFIQETFLNDAQVADDLVRAANDFAIDLRHVMQWPAYQSNINVPVADLSPYDQYLNLRQRALGTPHPELGTIGASPATCTIPAGESLCSVTIEWSTHGAQNVNVKVGDALFAQAPSGSQAAPWISANYARFDLFGDGVLIGSVDVNGVPAGAAPPPPPPPPPSAGLVTANPIVCTIPPGAATCTSVLSWNVPNASLVEVHIDGFLFARTGPSGTQEAPWITGMPANFELWADGALVDRITVRGQ